MFGRLDGAGVRFPEFQRDRLSLNDPELLLGDDQTFDGVLDGVLAAGRFREAMDFEMSELLSFPRIVMPLGLPDVEGRAVEVADRESLRFGVDVVEPVPFLGVSKGREPVVVEAADDGDVFP